MKDKKLNLSFFNFHFNFIFKNNNPLLYYIIIGFFKLWKQNLMVVFLLSFIKIFEIFFTGKKASYKETFKMTHKRLSYTLFVRCIVGVIALYTVQNPHYYS